MRKERRDNPNHRRKPKRTNRRPKGDEEKEEKKETADREVKGEKECHLRQPGRDEYEKVKHLQELRS